MKSIPLVLGLVAIGFAVAPTASQAAIVVVNSVTTSTTASNGTSVSNIINGSGLSAVLDESNKLTVTHGMGFNATTEYITNQANGGTFTFNFTNATLGQILIWNYSQNDIRGLDAITNVEIDTGAGFVSVITNFNLTTAAAAGLKAQALDLGGQYSNVSSVRLTVAQGITSGAETAGGFDEVAFSSVPEPTVALLGSLGLLGLLKRRR